MTEETLNLGNEIERKGKEQTKQKEIKKILFFGQFTLNHSYGCQGLAFPVVEYLNKYLDVEYTFMISEQHYEDNIDFCKEKGFKIVKFPYPKFWKDNKELIKAIRESDVIIDVDGIEYIGSLTYIKRWFHYCRVNYIHWLARKYNKIYLKAQKSYGPFTNNFFNFMVKRTLNRLPFVLVRGEENLKQIKTLNLKVPVYDCPDGSFILEPEKKEWAEQYLIKLGLDINKEIIGISPSYVINNINNDHVDLCKDLIEYFQSIGKQVLIIPHSINNNMDVRSCDLALSESIYEDLKKKDNVFIITDVNIEYKHVRSIMGFLSFYITGRYHGVISSLYVNVPSVVFSWHVKYKDVLSLFLDKLPIIEPDITSKESLELIKNYYNNQDWFNGNKVQHNLENVQKRVREGLRLIKLKC